MFCVSHTSIGPDPLTITPGLSTPRCVISGPFPGLSPRTVILELSSSNPQYRPTSSSSVGHPSQGPHLVHSGVQPTVPALQGPSTQVHTVSPSEAEPHTPRPGYIRHLVTGPSYIQCNIFSTNLSNEGFGNLCWLTTDLRTDEYVTHREIGCLRSPKRFQDLDFEIIKFQSQSPLKS